MNGMQRSEAVRAAMDRGRDAIEKGDPIAARAELEPLFREATGDPELMSLYGLSLSLAGPDVLRGVALCEEAIRKVRSDATAEMYWCVARAYLTVRYRAQAVAALRSGAAVDPEHGGIHEMLTELGIRRPPVVPFLSRGNLFNKYLGMLRHRLFPPHNEV